MAHPNRDAKQRRAQNRTVIAERAAGILAEHNQKLKEESKAASNSKKKTHTELLDLVPYVKYNRLLMIRRPEDWVAKSFNLERQIFDFVNWCFCEFPVPHFMYSIFVPKPKARWGHRSEMTYDIFFDWFITIGQGESFAKRVKGLLTKKEAHLFLSAPRYNSIIENIWWTRCVARGLPDEMTRWLSKHSLANVNFKDMWWLTVLDFFHKWLDELNILTLQEIMDYLHRVRNLLGQEFSMKGRTLASVIRLSNEWHAHQQKVKRGGHFSWAGAPIDNWRWEDKKNGVTYLIEQIRSSTDLYREGRAMKHCVYGYANQCANGETSIFRMMDSTAERYLTIEVRRGEIIQARGKLNRKATNHEHNILTKWAIHNNLEIGRWV